MKSRYKKHLNRVMRRNPVVVFSKEDKLDKKTMVSKDKLHTFDTILGLEPIFFESSNYKLAKKEIRENIIIFVDNYLLCGGNQYVYILAPLGQDDYNVIEKESIDRWRESYWEKEDPNNKRDWSYMDEDVQALFEYLINQFDKYTK